LNYPWNVSLPIVKRVKIPTPCLLATSKEQRVTTEIVHVKATAKEVSRVIENIKEVVKEEAPSTVLMAALGLAIAIQSPDMELKDLATAISHTSNWIAFYLENEHGIPKEKVN
jgi:hypothetical protein